MELRILDLERELAEWRESRTRELAGSARSASGQTAAFRRGGGTGGRRYREFPHATGNPERGRGYGRSTAGRSTAGGAADRTQVLIDRGRLTARRPRSRRRRTMAVGSAAGLVLLAIAAMIVFRPGPSWPSSVATVRSEITTACQNPDIAAEPTQVNFACGQATSQILWVFALLTSNDNPGYADAKTGRKGLEPITPAQGGEIAWSLNLHHPYSPSSPVDSLEVAARAINNIIGGATLTGTNGNPVVQSGLESKPENCARYTGSPAITARAGFPTLCASPVTSGEGQAALVADVYRQWMPGATPVASQDASVLFEDANNPGDPQVQAILKTLPGAARSGRQPGTGGVWVTRTAPFRVYHNVAESIEDHSQLPATGTAYRRAMANLGLPDAFATALAGVYATDPDYGANLIALMRLYNLYRYDSAPPEPQAAGQQAAVPRLPGRSRVTPALGHGAADL